MTAAKVDAARSLNEIAAARGQSLSEMALAWLLADRRVTSVIIGASSVSQLLVNLKAVESRPFTSDELERINTIAASVIHTDTQNQRK